MPVGRSAEVPAGRFPGWVDRFRAGHGGRVRLSIEDDPTLRAVDGATAALDVAFDPGTGWADLTSLLTHVARVAASHPFALLLVRRGGWAVARCEGERVVASKVGTRYVQGRTKKGGSSQQRYARRRGNQADSVVSAAVEAASDVWGVGMHRGPLTVITGGDRLLLADAVGQLTKRAPLAVSARRLEVPDPLRAVLHRAAEAACAVRVHILDPAAGA